MDNPDWTTYILRKSISGSGSESGIESGGGSPSCTPPASIAACPGHADKATCEGDETCKWSGTAGMLLNISVYIHSIFSVKVSLN